MILLYMMSVSCSVREDENPGLQPIVDTGGDAAGPVILGHECLMGATALPRFEPGRNRRYFIGFTPLMESGVMPARIVFQIPASNCAFDSPRLRVVRKSWRRNGFEFALDDVGAGESPLRSIRKLRPDYIKLGESLVANVEKPLYASTIRRLVDVAGELEITVIAKGVGNVQTMENLWLLGVRCMQGRLFRDADTTAISAALGSLPAEACAGDPARGKSGRTTCRYTSAWVSGAS